MGLFLLSDAGIEPSKYIRRFDKRLEVAQNVVRRTAAPEGGLLNPDTGLRL
jgi:hypothetical protein